MVSNASDVSVASRACAAMRPIALLALVHRRSPGWPCSAVDTDTADGDQQRHRHHGLHQREPAFVLHAPSCRPRRSGANGAPRRSVARPRVSRGNRTAQPQARSDGAEASSRDCSAAAEPARRRAGGTRRSCGRDQPCCGRPIVTTSPPPAGWASAIDAPGCARSTCAARARPSPAWPGLSVRNGWNTRARTSARDAGAVIGDDDLDAPPPGAWRDRHRRPAAPATAAPRPRWRCGSRAAIASSSSTRSPWTVPLGAGVELHHGVRAARLPAAPARSPPAPRRPARRSSPRSAAAAPGRGTPRPSSASSRSWW